MSDGGSAHLTATTAPRPGGQRGGLGARSLPVLTLVTALLAGCPAHFDPRAAPVKSSPDPLADAAFRQARTRFEAGATSQAQAQLQDFVKAHPSDPLRPIADIYLARIAFAEGRLTRAETLLRGPATSDDPAVGEPARYYLGLTLHRLGRPAEARRLLRPFVGRVAGDDAAEVYGALADAAARLGDVTDALAQYEAFYGVAKAHERAWARQQARKLVSELAVTALEGRYREAKGGSLAAAALGERLASVVGDQERRQAILAQVRDARESFGLLEEASGSHASAAAVSGHLIGCLVPLTGKARAVGEAALQGALLGNQSLMGTGQRPGLLVVRDTGGDPVRAEQAVAELVDEGVAAIIGPVTGREVAAAGRAAARLGVPLVALDVRGVPQPWVFHLLASPEQRAMGLARHAARAGVRRVAIAAPDNAYGRRLASAFARALKAVGLQVVAEERYQPGATTFAPLVSRLKARRIEALFVPDRAATLELLAPALARGGLWPRPRSAPREPRSRNILLLSTAEGLTDRLTRAAGRYVQGAVLAPGFIADTDDHRHAAFAARFQDEHGGAPQLFHAAGFDATRLLAKRLAAGATSRETIRARLQGEQPYPGVTGQISFGADGRRTDTPLLYEVDGSQVRLLRPTTTRPPARAAPGP